MAVTEVPGHTRRRSVSRVLITYADDRELDARRIRQELPDAVLLRTGVGKLRSATAVSLYLQSNIREDAARVVVVSVGTCAGLVPGLAGQLVRPARTIDRDCTPELMRQAGIEPTPPIDLTGADSQQLTIATGDGFVADETEAARILDSGAQLVDMETYAVAWAVQNSQAGTVRAIRYVSDAADPNAPQDWVNRLDTARRCLTEAVLAAS
jgi:nucleoside phosphorylase